VASGTNGNRTATLLNITTKIYGLVLDGKHFPTCSSAKIAAAGVNGDTVCPAKAAVAKGAITALLGSASDLKKAGAACNPLLHVWNGGQGKLVYFFVDQAPNHKCLGGLIHTGQVGPYPATYTRQGNNLVINVPIPTYVDYPLGPNVLVGSLTSENLTYQSNTTTVGGKKVVSIASVGCKTGKKRPYSVSFKARLGSGTPETTTVSHVASC
jgi:hypothetical protein